MPSSTISTALATASPSMSMAPSTLISASGAYGGCRSATGLAITDASLGLIEHLPEQLEVLPSRPQLVRRAEQVRRMIGGDERDSVVHVDSPAELPDGGLGAGQHPDRVLADREEHARRDRGDLAAEERHAVVDLVRERIPVLRRTALQDVADEHVLARQAHREEEPVEEFPGPAHERPAGPVFFRAGRLAHDDHLRRRVPFPEHHGRPGLVQPAPGARFGFLPEHPQRGRPVFPAARRRGRGRWRGGDGGLHRRCGGSGGRDHPALARENVHSLLGRESIEKYLLLTELALLAEVAGQQFGERHHERGSRSAATRSRIASATSCFDISGSAVSPPERSRITTWFVSTSNPEPGRVASFRTMRSRSLDSSFRRAFAAASSVSSAKPTTTSPGRLAARVARSTSGAGSSGIASGA